jgi:hypothetical protein
MYRHHRKFSIYVFDKSSIMARGVIHEVEICEAEISRLMDAIRRFAFAHAVE